MFKVVTGTDLRGGFAASYTTYIVDYGLKFESIVWSISCSEVLDFWFRIVKR